MPGNDIHPLKENIQPTLRPTQIGSTLPTTPFVPAEGGVSGGGPGFLPPPAKDKSGLPTTVTTGELYESRKFALYDPTKTEEDYAYGQSAWDKAGNGLAKLVGTTAITIADNTAGLLYGTVAAIGNQKFSSLFDNDFFRYMDRASEEMENKYPHYYTEAERQDPLSLKSVFTGNFFWDKIIKNLGFAAGAAATGYAAGTALEALGLSRGLVAAGKAMQALEASETAIAEGRGIAGMVQALKNPKSVVSKFGEVVEGLGTIEAGAKMSTATRALSAFLGTTGEAGLESYQNAKQFRENSIKQFKETYGEEPAGKDLQDIEDYAAQVGNWSFGLNSLLLTATQYVQLPKIFGSTYSGEKRTLNNLLFKEGAWQSALPQKGLNKFLYKTGNVASLFFNTAEGFEEGAQYAIQQGTNAFFNKKYRSKEETSFWNSLGGLMIPGGEGVLGEGVKKAVTTAEGLENILIGGLSGAIMTSGIVGFKTDEKGVTLPTIFKTGKIGERGFTGYGGERGKFESEAISALNTNKLSDLVDSVNRAMTLAEQRERSLRQGDVLNSKDLETDYMLNYLLPRIKYGGKEMFDAEIDYMRQQAITDEGFRALQESGTANENDTKEAFVARLENVRNIADQVNENYTKFKTSYAGVALTDEEGKPILDEKGALQRKYSDVVIDKMVYNVAKIFDYNNRIPQLTAKLSEKGILVDNALSEVNLTGKPSKETMKTALDAINNVKDFDVDDLKTALTDVIELTQRRNKFFNEFADMKKDPSKYEEKKEEQVEPGETVKVKQIEVTEKGKKKTVSKELEVGKEYALSEPVVRSGNTLQLGPKLTVLSKTLNGEFEVRLPDGTRTFLSPSEFKSYPVSTTETLPTLTAILDKAIDSVLSRKKYSDLQSPETEKLDYINSLNNAELVSDVQKEFVLQSKAYLDQKAKEEKILQTADLNKKLLETTDNTDIQTEDSDKGSYEPDSKKTNQQVTDSTKPPVEEYSQEEPLAEHHVRANRFGANFYTFPNNENFRGVLITSKNEAQLGIPGLTQWLASQGKVGLDEEIDPNDTIALVVMGIDPITNEKYFVDVNGNKLTNPTVENTIYQVFPKKLTWSDGKSMFRETTSEDEIIQYTKDYNAWRKSTLENPASDLYRIQASFGSPRYVGELNDKGKFKIDANARVGVESSGLITDADLRNRRVIGIPTTDGAVTWKTSTFNAGKGMPLLYANSGLLRLQNKKFSEKEATLIYQVIERLANNLFNDKNLQSAESQALYNWLKSVVYWGTPKDATGKRQPAKQGSIFIEEMKLIMGKEETSFSINPADLKQNRDAIIAKLQTMYNNVNSTLVTGGQTKEWNKPYTEITGISSTGEIQTRQWKNYQTYLLSNKNPDGSPRDGQNIPLTTQIRPLKNAEDTNRKGVYFTLVNKQGTTSQEVPEVKPAPAPSQPAAPVEQAAPGYVLDGKTENKMEIPNIGEISFIIDQKKFEESNGVKGVSISVPETTLEITVGKLMKSPNSGITEDTDVEEANAAAENILRNIVVKEVKKQLAPAPAVTPAPAPTAPVSDVEAERADKISKLYKIDPLLAAHYVIATVGVPNEYGSDTTAISVLLNLPYKEADKLANQRIEAIKPAGWKFGDDYDKTELNNKVKDALAALEGAKPAETKPAIAASLQQKINQRKQAGPTKRGSDFRLKLASDLRKFDKENWQKVEAWLTSKFPILPVYRVKNIIQATNGRQAWGMLHDSAIYLYQNAEVGTAYHEVFEAVWKMFSSAEERASIINEFKGRKGSFTDRVTGRDIKYSEATDFEIKEQLAEEFREYVLTEKLPGKPTEGKSWIRKLFTDIVNFFKSFFFGEKAQTNTANLFERIGNGYYAKYSPNDAALSFAKVGIIDIEDAAGDDTSEFSLEGFSGEQLHDIMQHMTYTGVKYLFETNQGLFNIEKDKTKASFYKVLEDELGDLIADNIVELEKMRDEGESTEEEASQGIEDYNSLYERIMTNWKSLQKKHEEYIKTYGIEFDENDDIALGGEDKVKEDPFGEATKIDSMRKANSAIKLLLASMPLVDNNGKEKRSSIGGYTLIPMSEVFMGTMNNLHTSRNPTEMVDRLKVMADNDPKYIKLYNRLTKLKSIDKIDDMNDVQLLSAFWRTFKKQAPTVKNVYVLENGDIQVGDSNFGTAARQVENEFINSIVGAIEKGSKYFSFVSAKRSYIGNEKSIKEADLSSLQAQVDFLKELGIEFDYDRLVLMPEKTRFSEAVNGIRTSIANGKYIITVNKKTLDIAKRLFDLAEIKAKMDNPEFSSTYYSVKGELTQTFIGTNAASDLYDAISQISNINELKGTQHEYLLTDVFAKNSTILSTIFDLEGDGRRRSDTEELMHVAYADGTVNTETGKQKQSSKLTDKERFLQQLNLNTHGYYMNLVPGDASIEWMLYMGNRISKNDILLNNQMIYDIFRGYFIDELNLSRDGRFVAKGKNSKDLRFFKSILSEKTHNDIIGESEETSAEEIYEKYKDDINTSVENLVIRERDKLKQDLRNYGALEEADNKFTTEGLNFGRKEMTEDDLNRELSVLSANYMINNIELHKLLYADPYQYSDELKRIKNFNSPHQQLINNSSEMNTAFDSVWNKDFKEGTPGWTNFQRDYFRTVTLADVEATIGLKDYDSWEETDGGGIILLKAHRNFKIRAGEWDGEQERQYKYEVVWEKNDKGGKLTKSEKKILANGNPGVKRVFTPIKPKAVGNKANGRNYNDIVLDKFALYPLSYRVMKEINPTSNAVKLYNKMQAEDIDYAVFKSGRKVGAEKVHELYNKETGEFNDAPFQTQKEIDNPKQKQGVINIPFAILSVQSEVPSKDINELTRGSQMTKLATLDFMEAGVPIDFDPTNDDFNDRYKKWNSFKTEEEKETNSPLYKEIKNNQAILEALIEEGVNTLLSDLHIEKTDLGYQLPTENIEAIANKLKEEFTKREINENISRALEGFKSGDVVIEATPAYQQIRNILYSIADRNVISPKMSGSMKVQIPSTLLESVRKVNEKGMFESDVLKFYEDKDGQRVCEIMVGRWFESDMSDSELLDYLNNTEEGKKILSGIAFRIPTQKQNSIDVFRIAKFLPEEFGDSVVVPSALVKKVGSDFDIDKLSIYLKNVDDAGGKLRLIPFQGVGEDVRKNFKYRSDYKKSLENGYIESLEKLTSHELNFKRLISPNSADQLKDLAKEITTALGFDSFSYDDPGNMLSRRFMTRLRQAFVSGKYAIGIAAVNQTNHSLNQRQPIYIDFKDRQNLLSATDKKYLKDGSISFKNYNKIAIEGKGVLPTVSMIENAAKKPQFISDIISQFIDGYVDISKGPWIMELGAKPNVASTWMFLTKLGVPIDTVAYFMNQPIIRDYLRELENEGYTWLFNDTIVKRITKRYKGAPWKVVMTEIPSNDKLQEMLGKTRFEVEGRKQLTPSERSQQQFFLGEFLKYAKMAEHLFLMTQGTNFDTASFNDPFLVSKKLYQLDKARKTIFTSVDDLLENSFIGKLSVAINDVRNALATILRADRGKVRAMLTDVLTPYMDMNDRDFIRTSQRAVSTLFDWAVQTNKGLNTKIESYLVSKETNIAREMNDFIQPIIDPSNQDHPLHNNHVIKILKPLFGAPGEVNNLQIKNKGNKVYDQNQLIYAFKELKNYLRSMDREDLYTKLVELSILQSGLSESTISFTNLLPYDDVKDFYNDVLADLNGLSTLESFKSLNVFERTFWNYDDIVPHMKASYRFDFFSQMYNYNENMQFTPEIYNAIQDGRLPKLLRLPETSREAENDVIVYTWEDQLSKKEKAEKIKAADYSFRKKGLFKKVGKISTGEGRFSYIYKAINAWGDGQYAKEFYPVPMKSKIDNGFIQADENITDKTILSYFGITPQEVVQEEEITEPTPVEPVAETPVVEGAPLPVIYKDKQKRVRIDYPKTITVEIGDTKYNFSSVDLLRASQVKFDGNRIAEEDALVGDYPEAIGEKYGDAAKDYVGMLDIEISVPEAEFLRDNPKFANSFMEAFLSDELGEGQSFQEYAQSVLDRNEKLVDKGQLKLFTGFDNSKAFTDEQKQQIYTNFAAKHTMNVEQAREYINDAFASEPEKTISKLKECYL